MCLNIARAKQERREKFKELFQLFYSCAIRPFTLSIMTFIIMKPLEAQQRVKGERRKYFPRVTITASHDRHFFPTSLVAVSDFHRQDTKANINLSMFYFIICCGAVCARKENCANRQESFKISSMNVREIFV